MQKNITQIRFFLQNRKKTETEIFAFCVINFELIKIYTCLASQNHRLNFSFVEDIHVAGEKMTKSGLKTEQLIWVILYVTCTKLVNECNEQIARRSYFD